MIDKKTCEAILQVRDSARSKNIKAFFTMHREKSHLLRIGNNSVSLNTSTDLTRLDVEVIDGHREGSYSVMTDISNPAVVENALQAAVEKATVATAKEYKPFEPIVEKTIKQMDQYDPSLEEIDPVTKVETYRDIIDDNGDNYNYSGSWSSGSTEIFLAGTANENTAWRKGTDQQFSCVLKDPVHKWELANFQTGWQAGAVTANNAISDFKHILPVFRAPGIKVEPGEYTVVFGSQALADILRMLMWTGLNGKSYEEKMGWTTDKSIGDQILSENVTIVDDPSNMDTFGFSFDMKGMARGFFPFVEEGRMVNLFYDIDTAGKYKRKPTPHNDSASLVMRPGEGPENPLEAVRNMGRVLFIPALHYVHIPNPSKGLFTGSSRFSALLLENGEMKAPILSSRITDTFQNVFGNVELISSAGVSVNSSSTYDRRMPQATSVPSYMVSSEVKVTDSADSF